jgi:hypothetical protein
VHIYDRQEIYDTSIILGTRDLKSRLLFLAAPGLERAKAQSNWRLIKMKQLASLELILKELFTFTLYCLIGKIVRIKMLWRRAIFGEMQKLLANSGINTCTNYPHQKFLIGVSNDTLLPWIPIM